MNIRNFIVGVLLSLMASTTALAASVIGVTTTPATGLPPITIPGYVYRVTYTISNNHPRAAIPISVGTTSKGAFDVIDECNGLTLAPKGQPNSTCSVSVTYTAAAMHATSQTTVTYGYNRVNLNLSTDTTGVGSSGSQGRLIGYMPGYYQPSSAQALFNAGYTDILVAFGVFSTTSPGTIVSAFSTVSPALIQQMKKLGIKVLLSLGGASTNIPNTTVNFHDALAAAASPAAFKTAFIASMNSLMTTYGFDGFDFDIEFGLNPGVGGTISNPGGDIQVLADIINTMHTAKPNVMLTLAPQTVNISAGNAFGNQYANYSALIMKTQPALTWVGIQIYNSGSIYGIDSKVYTPNTTSTPDASVALAADALESWPQGAPIFFLPYVSTLTPSQVVLGYLAPNASGQTDGAPLIPQTTIKRAVQCLRTAVKGAKSCDTYVPPRAYPGLGGVFGWQTTNDQSNGFKFATGLKACVLNGNCN